MRRSLTGASRSIVAASVFNLFPVRLLLVRILQSHAWPILQMPRVGDYLNPPSTGRLRGAQLREFEQAQRRGQNFPGGRRSTPAHSHSTAVLLWSDRAGPS